MKAPKEREIKWHNKNLKIFQVPNEGLEFAFLSDDYRQSHQLVWCKDFMQDAIHAQINQKPIEIYGFSYDPNTSPPICLEETRIMITSWKDQEFPQKVFKSLEFLNQIEDKLGMKKTIVEKCSKTPPTYRKSGVWIMKGDKRWVKAPPMISLYTLLIRIGLIHNSGDSFVKTLNRIKYGKIKPYNWRPPRKNGIAYDNDQNFLKNGRKGFDAIMKHGDADLFFDNIRKNYPKKISSYLLHDSCGIVGFSQEKTKRYFPYWHRLGA